MGKSVGNEGLTSAPSAELLYTTTSLKEGDKKKIERRVSELFVAMEQKKEEAPPSQPKTGISPEEEEAWKDIHAMIDGASESQKAFLRNAVEAVDCVIS